MESSLDVEETKKEYRLTKDSELRIEVESGQSATLILKSGLAEIFGTELMKGRSYTFPLGSKIAVFTYHGCVIELEGHPEVIDRYTYMSNQTPMTFYLNVHGLLEQMRDKASSIGDKGPVVVVCGPANVGKSTFCRILANYAVRRQRTPLLIDLDVGQGFQSVPGTVTMTSVERSAEVESGFSDVAPLAFHFGFNNPGANMNLYLRLITRLAEVMTAKFDSDRKVKTSGAVINTCGWVDRGGYKALVHAIQTFEADVVLVLDQERLYNDLVRDLPTAAVKVVFTPKSGGVVARDAKVRGIARDAKIREYFYGRPDKGLYPHSFDIPFASLKVYRVGAPDIPQSCLPIGMKTDDSQTKLTQITAIHQLLDHQLLSVSFCSVSDKHLAVDTNIQGIVCVTKTDDKKGIVTLLSPQPKPLPTDCILLTSEIQFIDSA